MMSPVWAPHAQGTTRADNKGQSTADVSTCLTVVQVQSDKGKHNTKHCKIAQGEVCTRCQKGLPLACLSSWRAHRQMHRCVGPGPGSPCRCHPAADSSICNIIQCMQIIDIM